MEEKEMEEWEIVEYKNYNNFRDIDDDDDDDDYEKRSKLEWILETGLSLGKNAVMTGVIISSIPILVPPFVVIAALGCAFSLPLGFVYATYSCTNKIITKLLPVPSPPPPPICYPEGEEKQMEAAVKDGVETRIELVDDISNEFDQETAADDDNNNKPLFGSVGPDTATINAEKVDLYAAAAEAEDIKISEENEEEKIAEVEKTEDTVAKGPTPKRRGGKRKARKKKELEGDDQNFSGGKGIGKVLDDEKVDQEDKQAPSAESNPEILLSDDNVVNVDSSKVEEHEVIIGDDEQSVDISKTSSTGESYDQAKTVAGDGELKHDNEKIPRAVDGDDVEHEVLVETNGKNETSTVDVDVDVVFSEIAVDVFTNDDEGVVDKKIEVHSVTVYNEPGGEEDNQAKAKTVADDEVKEEITETRVVGDDARSDEGLLGEDEEIRKKMEGIRAIVGYKGPKVDSYTEELKALYVFIGIEPPPDSADFQNKLRFLMSVIGLK